MMQWQQLAAFIGGHEYYYKNKAAPTMLFIPIPVHTALNTLGLHGHDKFEGFTLTNDQENVHVSEIEGDHLLKTSRNDSKPSSIPIDNSSPKLHFQVCDQYFHFKVFVSDQTSQR